MKVEISYGCTAFYTLIDGKLTTEADLDKALDYILPQVRAGIKDGTISFDSLIQIFQYTSSVIDKERCDQCGDTVIRDIYEI